MKIHKSNNGFMHAAIVLALLVVGVVGFVGWRAVNSRQASDKSQSSVKTVSLSPKVQDSGSLQKPAETVTNPVTTPKTQDQTTQTQSPITETPPAQEDTDTCEVPTGSKVFTTTPDQDTIFDTPYELPAQQQELVCGNEQTIGIIPARTATSSYPAIGPLPTAMDPNFWKTYENKTMKACVEMKAEQDGSQVNVLLSGSVSAFNASFSLTEHYQLYCTPSNVFTNYPNATHADVGVSIFNASFAKIHVYASYIAIE